MWDPQFCHRCCLSAPHCVSSPLHQSLPISAPLTCLDECGFFKVVRLPYSSVFWPFWVLFVLRFSCNSLWLCKEVKSVSTYASILTGSLLLFFQNQTLNFAILISKFLSGTSNTNIFGEIVTVPQRAPWSTESSLSDNWSSTATTPI